MSEREPQDELDGVVQALMTNRSTSGALSPAVAAMVGVAEQLLDLPDPAFRRQLKSELLALAGGATPKLRAMTGDPNEIRQAAAEMAARSRFLAYDLHAALHDLPELSMRFLAPMNECVIGVSRFSQRAHWERHPAADELLYVVDGSMEVTTLTADGPVVSSVAKGAAYICPRGLWHRVEPRGSVSTLFVTPGEGTEHSNAAHPQVSADEPLPPASVLTPPTPLLKPSADRAMLDITAATTDAEADAAFRELFTFNQCAVTVGTFRGLTPWERHSGGDELLHVIDGEVEITVLTDEGPVRQHIPAGSIFVCPRGLWHRQYAAAPVTGIFATPRPSDVSTAEDPRFGA